MNIINIILVSLFFTFLVIYMVYHCFIRENRILNIFGRMKIYNDIINNNNDNKLSENNESFNYDEV